MKIKLYTTPTCNFCLHMKTLLKRANLEWEEVEIGKDISMEDFKSEYPSINHTPFTIIDGRQYMTISDVAKKFLEEGLVSAPKLSAE